MSSNNEDFYAQVVYTGLSRMTTDRNTIKSAFEFWHKKLSNRPFNIKEVVAYLERYAGLSTAEKKALFIAMQAASNKLPSELEVLPGYLTGGDDVPEASVPVAENLSSHNIVSARVLQSMASQVKRLDREAFAELATDLADVGFDEVSTLTNQALLAWSQANLSGLALPKIIAVDECKNLFHAFYLLCTELVGPVATDDITNVAVAETAKIEQAIDFDPRDLL